MLDAINRAKRQTSLVTSGVTRGFPGKHIQMHNEDTSPIALHSQFDTVLQKTIPTRSYYPTLPVHVLQLQQKVTFGNPNVHNLLDYFLKRKRKGKRKKAAVSVNITITIPTHPRGKLDKWHIMW
jgi:hypothetical protein